MQVDENNCGVGILGECEEAITTGETTPIFVIEIVAALKRTSPDFRFGNLGPDG
jgi:hypothetical protein